jgi:hypothetical protein
MISQLSMIKAEWPQYTYWMILDMILYKHKYDNWNCYEQDTNLLRFDNLIKLPSIANGLLKGLMEDIQNI